MRLFVAIGLSDKLKAELRKAQRALAAFDHDVRWVGNDQMHLTLKFLGEVLDDRVEEVSKTTQHIARAASRFELTVRGCGCFPPNGRVRVVWAGIEEPTGALAACGELCEARFADLGFERERRAFSPHLTLGRVREDRTGGRLRDAVGRADVGPCAQPAEAICVMQSTLTPGGARYTIVSRHELGTP